MDYNEPFLTLQLSGLNHDIPAQNLPLDTWSSGQNVRFVDGSTEKFKGQAQVFGALTYAPNWFQPVGYGANYYWVYADTTGIAVTDMFSHFDITPAAGVNGDIDTNWNGGLLNNLLFMNNGIDAPVWWDGDTANVMTALPNWPAGTTAKVIRAYKNFLVALNITESGTNYPDRVLWSDAAPTGSVPSSWDVSDPETTAGHNDLADTFGEIMDGMSLGDAFIIYKRYACYTLQYVGGQYVHKFRKLYDSTGIMASDCVAEFNGKHLVLTASDIVVHDGSPAKPRSILTKRMRNWLFNSINTDNYHRSFVKAYRRKREIWVCVPIGGSSYANLALVWNYESDTIGMRELPNCRYAEAGLVDPGESIIWDDDTGTWDSDSTTWDETTYSPTAASFLMGDQSNNRFLEADNTDQFAGTDMLAYVERTSMPLIDRRNMKLVKALYPSMQSTSSATVYWRVGTQNHPGDSIDWSARQAFVIGTDDRVDVLKKGRYISLRCESEDDVNWILDEMTMEIELAERY